MFPARFEYRRAGSVQEAVALLAEHDDAKLLAGGHSLLPAMKLRAAQPALVVDVGRIPGLSGVEAEDGGLRVGALTTHAEVADSALVRERCPMIAETAASIGDIQVRNRGTIGGSLAHADPGADYPAAMLASGASIVAVGPGGERAIPADGFFVGILATALAEDEMITGVRIPAASGGAYRKHRHPASSYAVVGAAARVALDGAGNVSEAAVAVNGVLGSPALLTATSEALVGGPPTPDRVAKAAARAGANLADPLGDLYASGEFRVHLAGVYAKRALTAALSRAGA